MINCGPYFIANPSSGERFLLRIFYGSIVAEQISNNTQAELLRRHRTVSLTIRLLILLTVALSVAAFLGKTHFRQQDNPTLDMALRITILTFGLGSVVLRRTRFSAMRLQDVAGLKGVSGLLATLERTTLQVAGLGVVVAVFGFLATVMTGNDFYSYGAGFVGLVVLLYCYPTRSSWQKAVEKFGAMGRELLPSRQSPNS
jgi:O-antigen/teichoic acid export membrane protein